MRNYITRCFSCGKPLARMGTSFALIRDPINNVQRVHKQCVAKAVGDGYKEVTATSNHLDFEIEEVREKVRVLTGAGLHASARVQQSKLDSLIKLKEQTCQ